MTVQIDAQHVVDGHIIDLAIAFELDVDGIQIQDGVDWSQGPVLPRLHQRPDLVCDGADRIR